MVLGTQKRPQSPEIMGTWTLREKHQYCLNGFRVEGLGFRVSGRGFRFREA